MASGEVDLHLLYLHLWSLHGRAAGNLRQPGRGCSDGRGGALCKVDVDVKFSLGRNDDFNGDMDRRPRHRAGVGCESVEVGNKVRLHGGSLRLVVVVVVHGQIVLLGD